MPSTAAAAKAVLGSCDSAAICSSICTTVFDGLEILYEGIQDQDSASSLPVHAYRLAYSFQATIPAFTSSQRLEILRCHRQLVRYLAKHAVLYVYQACQTTLRVPPLYCSFLPPSRCLFPGLIDARSLRARNSSRMSILWRLREKTQTTVNVGYWT